MVKELKKIMKYDEWVLICKKCFKMIWEDAQKGAVFYLDSVSQCVCSMNDCNSKADYYILVKSEESNG